MYAKGNTIGALGCVASILANPLEFLSTLLQSKHHMPWAGIICTPPADNICLSELGLY